MHARLSYHETYLSFLPPALTTFVLHQMLTLLFVIESVRVSSGWNRWKYNARHRPNEALPQPPVSENR